MDTIELKKANVSDITALQKIGRETFHESFSADNTEADMQHYLDENFNLERLTHELNNPHSSFYFALIANEPIGYLKINSADAQTELKNMQALEIERIYVSKEFQGRKIGKLLYNKAVQIAQEMNAPYLWLGVWEKNTKAIQFYKKNGLVEFDKHIFKLGDDEQTDLLMKIELNTL